MDYSDIYLERWYASGKEDDLRQLLPTQRVLNTVCQFVGRTVRLAHSIDPSRWGITRLRNAFRVNVGPAEALLIRPDLLMVMIDDDVLDDSPLASWPDELAGYGPGSYRSVPWASYIEVAVRNPTYLAAFLEAAAPAHEQHLRRATAKGLNGATRKGHDPLLVDQISTAAGGLRLPQPSYVAVEGPREPLSTVTVDVPDVFTEGASHDVVHTSYERNAEARRLCLLHHGYSCAICGFSFEQFYGAAGRGLIHVHHLSGLAADGKRATDPVRDLRPLCPNCHLMVHATDPARTLEEVRAMLAPAAKV